ncbi:type II CAAX prenyl endopeptidase Rce1 family protein [Marisediminicola sp. LYQ85]|uniref:CPBP family glutamic-type intramembrane protease n=1 Tax=Marisediminicola sp. LYQ85 TaxID=3391062 RepID=UPI003983372E
MASPALAPPQRRTLELTVAVFALGAVVLLLAVVEFALSRYLIRDAAVGQLVSYLVVWVPLLGAVLYASRRFGSGSLHRDLGFRVRPLDLLWGIGVGLLARAFATFLEIAVNGGPSTAALQLGGPLAADRLTLWFVTAAVAPLVFAPLIEELFFRGTVLRAIAPIADARPTPRTAIIAIIASSIAFAIIHVVGAPSTSAMLVAGGSTLVFGLASGVLAVLTGRLGASITAHVTFNALVVLPALAAR